MWNKATYLKKINLLIKLILVEMKMAHRILIVILITLSCNSNDDLNKSKSFCSVENPTEDEIIPSPFHPWVADAIADSVKQFANK